MISGMRFYVCVLLVASLVLAAVSPACAFISGGKSRIEICAADGSVKTIEVAADEGAPSTPEEPLHKTQKDCTFCFNTSHFQKIGAGQPSGFVLPLQGQGGYAQGYVYILTSSQAYYFSARAPPVFPV